MGRYKVSPRQVLSGRRRCAPPLRAATSPPRRKKEALRSGCIGARRGRLRVMPPRRTPSPAQRAGGVLVRPLCFFTERTGHKYAIHSLCKYQLFALGCRCDCLDDPLRFSPRTDTHSKRTYVFLRRSHPSYSQHVTRLTSPEIQSDLNVPQPADHATNPGEYLCNIL